MIGFASILEDNVEMKEYVKAILGELIEIKLLLKTKTHEKQ